MESYNIEISDYKSDLTKLVLRRKVADELTVPVEHVVVTEAEDRE